MSLRHAPVVIQLSEKEIEKSDLMRELHVDKSQLGRELLRQPGKFAFWSSLYSEVSSKADLLEIQLEEKFGELAKHYYKKYSGKKIKATDLKHLIIGNSEYQKLRRRLWKWRKSERFLKGAVRAFEQRKDVLQSHAANERKERDAEPKVRKHE
jgi:hypothetical protein